MKANRSIYRPLAKRRRVSVTEIHKKSLVQVLGSAFYSPIIWRTFLCDGRPFSTNVLVLVVAGLFCGLRPSRSEYHYRRLPSTFFFDFSRAVELVGNFVAVVLSIISSKVEFPLVREITNYVNQKKLGNQKLKRTDCD